jgi:hypothetical protein
LTAELKFERKANAKEKLENEKILFDLRQDHQIEIDRIKSYYEATQTDSAKANSEAATQTESDKANAEAATQTESDKANAEAAATVEEAANKTVQLKFERQASVKQKSQRLESEDKKRKRKDHHDDDLLDHKTQLLFKQQSWQLGNVVNSRLKFISVRLKSF